MLLMKFTSENVLSTLIDSFKSFYSDMEIDSMYPEWICNELCTGMVSEGFLSGISGASDRGFHIDSGSL